MDERMRRQWAAAEALEIGWGGVSVVAQATGLARNTILAGTRELAYRQTHPEEAVAAGIRRPGGGRKSLRRSDPSLLQALKALLEADTRGHPECPLLWTCKSTANLAQQLQREHHPISDRTVATLLKEEGYSLQSNRKTKEGSAHPDRNAQFEHINRRVVAFQRKSQPVISVDTKKKELVGEFKNPGREWRPKGDPQQVQVHDFPDPNWARRSPMEFMILPATKVG